MKKRYAVLGLSIVLALALAVPALGGPSNPIASVSASVKSIANKALKKAKAAQTAANNAQNTANAASGAAAAAQKDATAAQKDATAAQKTATTAQSTATTALTTANSAKTAATAAQATADSALASANGKMSGEQFVSGSSVEGSGASVGCPAGKTPTGGGFILGGAEPNAATVISNSQYLNGWLVTSAQIKGVAGSPSWTTAATVMCATSP
ncbi:MAG TPA: hypothetical protein VFR04_08115 [Solirubrobacterales bacterium]|nr:hypothetical protein [Solirubrobacterales bacterium]